MEGCITNEDLLFQRAFEHLVPGGWLEVQAGYCYLASDDDFRERAPNALLLERSLVEGFNVFGMSMESMITWKEKLAKAAFVDIQQDVRKVCTLTFTRVILNPEYEVAIRRANIIQCPVGAWPKDPHLKEIGRNEFAQVMQAVDSYTSGLFTRVFGWSWAETEVFKAKVKAELRDLSIHLYFPFLLHMGKKAYELISNQLLLELALTLTWASEANFL